MYTHLRIYTPPYIHTRNTILSRIYRPSDVSSALRGASYRAVELRNKGEPAIYMYMYISICICLYIYIVIGLISG